MGRLLGGVMVIVAGTIGGLLGYGTYGYLMKKYKWSSWKAGAATGAITGIIASVATFAGIVQGPMGMLPGKRPNVALRKRYPSMYKQIGTLVVNKLYGCSAC